MTRRRARRNASASPPRCRRRRRWHGHRPSAPAPHARGANHALIAPRRLALRARAGPTAEAGAASSRNSPTLPNPHVGGRGLDASSPRVAARRRASPHASPSVSRVAVCFAPDRRRRRGLCSRTPSPPPHTRPRREQGRPPRAPCSPPTRQRHRGSTRQEATPFTFAEQTYCT